MSASGWWPVSKGDRALRFIRWSDGRFTAKFEVDLGLPRWLGEALLQRDIRKVKATTGLTRLPHEPR